MSKHIHFIGIAGVGTSALAIALHNAGYKVTGSDKGFFPPVSTELKKADVSFYPGFHPEKMGTPDLVIAGGSGTSEANPELQYARKKNIPVLSFAEAVKKFIVKEKSIVVAGTWGKTTVSAMLSFILQEAGQDPSYFIGGISLSHPSGKITESPVSVVEGDEYQAAIWDKNPKFIYYKPTDLVLTSVSWDHADLYPSEKSYFTAFQNLIGSVKDIIVANADSAHVTTLLGERKAIFYGRSPKARYKYQQVKHSEGGLQFEIADKEITHSIVSPLLGIYNAENITAAFAMARSLSIEPEKIISAIKKFKGIKRRIEKRYEGKTAVIDDIAHSPEKAQSTLQTLREIYHGKIIAIFEPNIGSRTPETREKYKGAFKDADEVIIPRLTKLKGELRITNNELRACEGKELAEIISQSHKNTKYIENDNELASYIAQNTKKGDAVVFLGSHGFRGMIEETISEIKTARD